VTGPASPASLRCPGWLWFVPRTVPRRWSAVRRRLHRRLPGHWGHRVRRLTVRRRDHPRDQEPERGHRRLL